MNSSVLLTGATGEVGAALLARLLAGNTVERIWLLLRAESDAAAAERSAALLAEVGQPDRGRVTIVRGDVTAPDLGINSRDAAALRVSVTQIVHAAADTRFNQPLSHARRVNRNGAANVLAAAARWPRLRLALLLSTVYVAGNRTGPIREDELEWDQGFVNSYERSKFEAERIAHRWMGDLPVAVARLSTVVGEAAGGRVRRFGLVHRTAELYLKGLLPLLPGDPAAPVDLIPTEFAAGALAHLLAGGAQAGVTYHVAAGEGARTLAELWDLIDAHLHGRAPAWQRRPVARPAIVDSATFNAALAGLRALRRFALLRAQESVAAFAPQLRLPKTFDRTNLRAALPDSAGDAPPLETYLPRVLDYCIAANWGRMSLRPEVAP